MKVLFFSILIPALLPVVLVLFYVWHKDKNEREPMSVILLTVVFGAVVSFVAGPVELAIEKLLVLFLNIDSVGYSLVENFFGVALVEEFLKWLIIMIFIWQNKNFDHSYDAIVYTVASSLGFAAAENIGYIIAYGKSVAISRALFAIPGHASFGVFMGYFVAKAKLASVNGRPRGAKLLLSVAVPTMVHGIYDFLLSPAAENLSFSGFFTAYVIVVDVASFFLIRSQFKNDRVLKEVSE